MANPKQLEILEQGVKAWNRWREEFPNVEIDLSRVDFVGRDIEGINLREANLIHANLDGANLKDANLTIADLSHAHIVGAQLFSAELVAAYLNGAKLDESNLQGVDLSRTNLSDASLLQVDLASSKLIQSVVKRTSLRGARFGHTTISMTDFSEAKGLVDARHGGPSWIDFSTIEYFGGNVPDAFLRGCGLSDWEIESARLYDPRISNEEISRILYRMYDLRAQQPLQISPLFISYSHADSDFVNRLEVHLNELGIRFWRDIHDAVAGRLEKQIDRAIRYNPTVLLILSHKSLESDWVQHEVRKAREIEKDIKRDVLCPVALDDSWKSSSWPEHIMEQVKEYNILDFSLWTNHNNFKRMFKKLVDGLNLYYKK